MFNIFVVNDWQEIARVYLTSDKLSSPYIVYPFFVSANLLGVNIMLNDFSEQHICLMFTSFF